MIYENGTLSRILIDGGYITMSGTIPTYHYDIQDHLGNNRVVFNQSGTVEQANHYYPFGMTFGEGTENSDNRYKYNGKELDRMHELYPKSYTKKLGFSSKLHNFQIPISQKPKRSFFLPQLSPDMIPGTYI